MHVGGGRAGGGVVGPRGQERDHVVISDGLHRGYRLGSGRWGRTNRLHALGRHRARPGLRLQDEHLHPAPQLVLVRLAPDPPHLGQRVPIDHGSIVSGGTIPPDPPCSFPRGERSPPDPPCSWGDYPSPQTLLGTPCGGPGSRPRARARRRRCRGGTSRHAGKSWPPADKRHPAPPRCPGPSRPRSGPGRPADARSPAASVVVPAWST